MKTMKRALRRHHRQRIIAKTMKLYVVGGVPEADRLNVALRLFKNRRKCSCWMCSQPRKWYGPTNQERRQPLPDE
jgi:predicted transcriptional regulator